MDNLLTGVLSRVPDEALTTEDLARLAQVNKDFEDELYTRVMELDADQLCALFDLARKGLEAVDAYARGQADERAAVVALRRMRRGEVMRRT
jgi:hypothetical protein